MLTKMFLRAAAMLLVMLLTTTTAWADSTFSGGDGSQGNPYQIKTVDDLNKLAQDVNSGTEYANTFFLLANDIAYEHTSKWNDATSTENNYTAIGYYDDIHDYNFRGTFDGDGHTISGIRIYKAGTALTDRYLGLFGQLGAEGLVKNLTLADSRITGFADIGSIVGYCLGTIENCTALATVFVSPNGVYEEDESEDFGGIAGFNNGSIIDCTSLATVAIGDDAEYCENIGGIVGFSQGKGFISNCTSSGTITIGNGTSECVYIGGIVGFSFGDNSISNCSSSTTITIGDNAEVCRCIGGIAGYCLKAMTNCSSSVTITVGDNANSCGYFGGIAGMIQGNTINCVVSSAQISIGSNPTKCKVFGGIVGQNYLGSMIGNLADHVTISGQNYIGAILGFDKDGYGTFANNYYSGCTLNGVPTAAGVGFNGADLEDNDGAVPATILSDEGASLPSSLSGKMAFRREFKGGKASTVVFPFDYTPGTEGTYYEFSGVSYDSGEGKWIATMTTAVTPLAANTPYLFMPAGTDGIVPVLFHGAAAASISAGTTTQGDWQFKGVYAKKTWAAADCGRDYGFAATSGKATDNVTDVEAGDFVQFAEGAWIRPMRSYLTYTGTDSPWTTTNAPAHRASSGDMPSSISVVLVNADGSTTILTPGPSLTGDGSDYWFTLDGRKLDKHPTQKGVYINNGRKVVVK